MVDSPAAQAAGSAKRLRIAAAPKMLEASWPRMPAEVCIAPNLGCGQTAGTKERMKIGNLLKAGTTVAPPPPLTPTLEADGSALPHTAGTLPLIGPLGLLALFGSLVFRIAERRIQ
jgi:hypothetical protein